MQKIKSKWGINIFGLIEIIIGLATLIVLITSSVLGRPTKSFVVLIFVLITSLVSLSLGIGILRRNLICYFLLLYFSTVIILSKILVFANIITLSGALETILSSATKNLISIFYHSLLILYFVRPAIRKEFSGLES